MPDMTSDHPGPRRYWVGLTDATLIAARDEYRTHPDDAGLQQIAADIDDDLARRAADRRAAQDANHAANERYVESRYGGAVVLTDYPDVLVLDYGPDVLAALDDLEHDGPHDSPRAAWAWLRDELTVEEAVEWLLSGGSSTTPPVGRHRRQGDT